MTFVSDFSESTTPDVYQLRVTVSDALEGQNLGPAQAHHILPTNSINADSDVMNWMLSLEANGLYKHNDISNALIMPTTGNGSLATGIAKHYGSHLGAPVGATDGYNKYVAQGLKEIRNQWLVHQDDALAAKQITGFIGTVLYLMQRGPVIKDGDTLGRLKLSGSWCVGHTPMRMNLFIS